MASRRAWADLPVELLEIVVEALPTYVDLLRFGAVCTGWRSAASGKKFPPRPLPYLMFPDVKQQQEEQAGGGVLTRCLYSLSEGKVHKLEMPEESRDWCCRGSSEGWLAMVDRGTHMFLFNPLTRDRVELPSLATLPKAVGARKPACGGIVIQYFEEESICFRREFAGRDTFVEKVALSSSDPNCVVMVIHGTYSSLAYARPGDGAWTAVQEHKVESYQDVIHHGGRFYAIGTFGKTVSIRIGGPAAAEVVEFAPVIEPPWYGMKYLVGLPTGELLQVLRFLDDPEDNDDNDEVSREPYRTTEFEIFRLEAGEEREWVSVECLGDYALFVGDATSLSISCSQTHGNGCKRNCIYFSDDYATGYNREWVSSLYGGHDLGIYHVEDESIESCYPMDSWRIMPLPIWFTPNS